MEGFDGAGEVKKAADAPWFAFQRNAEKGLGLWLRFGLSIGFRRAYPERPILTSRSSSP
jgi:hypothetical protein